MKKQACVFYALGVLLAMSSIALAQDGVSAMSGSAAKDEPVATGFVMAVIQPPDAVAAGAQWRLDTTVWHSSGETIEMPVGAYRIYFSSLPDIPAQGCFVPAKPWTTPVSFDVNVRVNETTTVFVMYGHSKSLAAGMGSVHVTRGAGYGDLISMVLLAAALTFSSRTGKSARQRDRDSA